MKQAATKWLVTEWLTFWVEINIKIFVVVYQGVFRGFTISIKVLKASLHMLGHTWPHPPKFTWSIYNFNIYEAACTKSTLYHQ